MRTDRPTPCASTTPSSVCAADGACVGAAERERGHTHVDDDEALAVYRASFRDAAYYSTGRDWEDYAPAYRCGLDAFAARAANCSRFPDVEPGLASGWPLARGDSRLGWAEARGAVLDAWLRKCDVQSGSIDRRIGTRRRTRIVGAQDAVAAHGVDHDAAGIAMLRHSPALDARRDSVAGRPDHQQSRGSTMSTLKKEHVAGTGGSAVAGGAAGAAIGAVVAGPVGLAVGAVAGTAVGALAGHKASNAVDASGDLGHFEDIYKSMPYYVREMAWSDYAPAYRYGLDTYRSHGTQGLGASEASLEAGWPEAKGSSRLLWSEARAAVAHAWRALDESMRNDPD